MQISKMVVNEITQEEDGIWRLPSHDSFNYSDGIASEKYLKKVFTTASDLSARSDELESYIKDWPSEYHLSRKRAQLLDGLNFEKSSRVLEVGCGCGAISRHLGENFDTVVSIEGSIQRARLARLRTRDLDTVSIICAPFQEIRFSQKFDVIFCIGVLEYSGAFIAEHDPYSAALNYFADILAPDGTLVIAIENQFGLKYFNGAREDHLGTYFEGLEGYHRHPGRARTFGRKELDEMLRREFPHTRFLYPYPDYKIPDCVLSEDLLASGKAGEIISQMKSRDYSGPMRAQWDDALVNVELAKNGALEFFANSFLVLASRAPIPARTFDRLGLLYSGGRLISYSTRTEIIARGDKISLCKTSLSNRVAKDARISLVETESDWINSLSLATLLSYRAQATRELGDIFAICRPWLNHMRGQAEQEEGRLTLEGAHLDSIWRNAYLIADECRLIDREWVWKGRISLNALIIRSIYDFLSDMEVRKAEGLSFLPRSGRATIQSIAQTMDVVLTRHDFKEFVEIESYLVSLATGRDRAKVASNVKWFLRDRASRKFARRNYARILSLWNRMKAKAQNYLG